MEIALNLTTHEYFTYNNVKEYTIKIRNFTTKLTTLDINNALTRDDIGESRWKKDDHIVIVPEHLQNYVFSQCKYLLIG